MRVLMVVSSYRPTMTPDMQRARMLSFDLPRYGWDVEILTPDVSYQRPQQVDADSAPFFAPDTPVHELPAWHPGWFRMLTIGSIGWRAYWPMYRRGAELLRSGRFDLVYFSTTQFGLFCLGRLWRRYGVPYVLDFQDPWYRPTISWQASDRWIKLYVSHWLDRSLERYAIRDAAGLIAVSPGYIRELSERYAQNRCAWTAEGRREAIPFAASLQDLEAVASLQPPAASNGQKPFEVVYIGAAGQTRAKACEALCAGLVELKRRAPQVASRLHFSLYGTSGGGTWGANVLKQIAERHGVGELFSEDPRQVSYYKSLELAAKADGLVIFGVDDTTYTPSKLFNYLLFSKPILGSLRSGSPACKFIEQHPEVTRLIQFGPENLASPEQAATALEQFVADMNAGRRYDNRSILEEHLAPEMARKHAALFDACLGGGEVSP